MPYKRNMDWRVFSRRVDEHIACYTVAQYGDAPDDPVEAWTPDQCVKAIEKYAKRFPINLRGSVETMRDLLKVAHFAQLAYDKMGGRDLPIPKSKAPEKKEGDYGFNEQ